MNRLALSLVASLLTLTAIPFAQAQTGTTAAPGGIVIADHVKTRAQVAEINYVDRTVVLKGEDGKTIELKVGPQAKNFNQVRVGDYVNADFYSSTAIFVHKADEPPSAGGMDLVQLAAPGERPGGLVSSTRELIARVNDVDPQNHTITVTGPSGIPATIKVGDSVQNLDQIKKGDNVIVRYTQAVALSVEKS